MLFLQEHSLVMGSVTLTAAITMVRHSTWSRQWADIKYISLNDYTMTIYVLLHGTAANFMMVTF